jgi:hypothetical protein
MLLDRHAVGERLVREELLARCLDRRLGGDEPGLGGGELRRDVVELLAADGAALHQRRAPGDVVLRAQHLAARARRIGLARRDLRLQGAVVDEQRPHLAHRLGQLRLGLLEPDLRVGAVERDERLAGLHVVGVVGMDCDHGAGDLRRHLDDVALHVGVVGALVVVQHKQPVQAPGQPDDQNHGADAEQCDLAARAFRRGRHVLGGCHEKRLGD